MNPYEKAAKLIIDLCGDAITGKNLISMILLFLFNMIN